MPRDWYLNMYTVQYSFYGHLKQIIYKYTLLGFTDSKIHNLHNKNKYQYLNTYIQWSDSECIFCIK